MHRSSDTDYYSICWQSNNYTPSPRFLPTINLSEMIFNWQRCFRRNFERNQEAEIRCSTLPRKNRLECSHPPPPPPSLSTSATTRPLEKAELFITRRSEIKSGIVSGGECQLSDHFECPWPRAKTGFSSRVEGDEKWRTRKRKKECNPCWTSPFLSSAIASLLPLPFLPRYVALTTERRRWTRAIFFRDRKLAAIDAARRRSWD